MEKATRELLEIHGFSTKEVAHVIPHQANVRIVESMANRLELPLEKFYCNLDRHGNTSAASIPIALDEAWKKDIFQKGDLVVLVAFGAGLTWSSTLVRF